MAAETKIKSPKRHMLIRKFNRAVYNRLVMGFAGQKLYALVEHCGRFSGKPYKTPVVAHPHAGYIYIPLPYGPDTDWYLNLKAADGGVVIHEGIRYTVRYPEVILASEALPVFSAYFRNAFKVFRIVNFLKLKVIEP
jgi:deazaflavin-dependent oxidoreductase (nitroreductase family)